MSRCLLLVGFVVLIHPASLQAQKNFGFDNRKPSGQPYLKPEETVKQFQVAPGWEAKLVAAEPDVINPIAFTIDEKGRLWVVECFEYPSRTPKGKKPRDRIKIIEETSQGPKVTIWAEGKDLPIGWDLATGIEVGHGGVFLGAPPYLFFLSDPDNTGKCTKQEILLKGFGSQDTHETLNTFQWGPDGMLYGLHGVFTHSEVTEPEASATAKPGPGVKMNAAVWRYDVRKKKFDIFAEGTSNPWGMDFDARGNCFVACCVIPHLFHIVPGGIYRRQAGASFHPYAYGELKEICDHVHHKESGWAHAGCLVLDGDHVPEEYRGSILMGSIHGCSIKRDVLRPNGSTFTASCAKDFLVSGDKNFRPINMRWGLDGSIYIIDWHDQNPCHQAAPDSWDQTHGRIYKVHPKPPFSAKPQAPTDLGKKTSKELVTEYLKNDNPYYYRTALRLLSERRQTEEKELGQMLGYLSWKSDQEVLRLRGLWGLHACGQLEPNDLRLERSDRKGRLRNSQPLLAWTLRLGLNKEEMSREDAFPFLEIITRVNSPQTRLQVAATLRGLSKRDPLQIPLLHLCLMHKEDARDPYLPFMIWLAYEPYVREYPNEVLANLKTDAQQSPLILNEILPRTMRRLAATGKADDLDACITFLADAKDTAVRQKALEGLVLAFKGRETQAPAAWKNAFAVLLKDGTPQVQDLARKLAVSFHDPEVIARALKIATDTAQAIPPRLDALRDLALAHPASALPVLLDLLARETSAELRAEVCRTLASYDNPALSGRVLAGWKSYPPLVRGEAVNLLSGRKTWAKDLLAALGTKQVARTDLTDNTILKIRAFKDAGLNSLIESHWGRFRDTPKELAGLIDKMRGQLHEGPGSFARGKLVFENQCAKCHKFDGKGHDVGPSLDGAARDIEYLLVNVIDPNRVVGQPYYMRSVELKNGRIETGLLAAEDDQSITLKVENNILKVIQKKDIEGKVVVHEKSVMPEGLANNMTVQDFRDLVRYVMAHPFVTQVAVAGPYGTGTTPPVDPANPLASTVVSWKKQTAGPPGRISLPSTKGPGGVALVTAEVTAPGPMRTRLLVGLAHPVKVWVNGSKVYDGQPGPAPTQPDQAGIEVELREGTNRLSFQVHYSGTQEALYARFQDPDRKLRYPEGEGGK